MNNGTDKQWSVQKLTLSAVMAALLFVMTFLIRIPVLALGGYIHMGDTVIYLCSYLLGGPIGAVVAGVGSALADLASGAAVYIIPTFVIKTLMGFLVGFLISHKNHVSHGFFALACLAGGAWMTIGYFLFETAAFGVGYALAALPYNLIQFGANVVCAVALKSVADRVKHML